MTFWEKFKIINNNIIEFIMPFLKILLTESGKILAEIALETVKTYASSGLTNEIKREMSRDYIKKTLSEKGISMAESVVNLAIEAAVVKMKAK